MLLAWGVEEELELSNWLRVGLGEEVGGVGVMTGETKCEGVYDSILGGREAVTGCLQCEKFLSVKKYVD